jgi:hypothetical protein
MNKVIDIPQVAPFTNCKLGREPYAQVLTDIVRTNSEGFVLAIDNKWGAGKTTFVTMWRHMLENENNGFKTLYFNAWENDFENNPFVAITAELKELLKNESSETFKEVVKKGNEIAKAAIPSIVKTFVKRYGGEDLAEIIEKTSEGVFEAFQEDIDSYVKRKQSIKDFHKELQNYINENSNGKPIVFIIDELDRCRPDYAVSVLENVKHLFSVNGIVFVLAIDKEQLGHAICGAYGSDNIDSNEYLRRFIDVEYTLPEPPIKNYIEYLIETCKLSDFFNLDFRIKHREMQRDKTEFIEYSKFLFELKKPTLRQQEKIFSHTGIVLRSFNSNAFIIPELLVFLIYVKLFHKNFYFRIVNRELTHQELLDETHKILDGNLRKESLNNYRISIEAMLVCYYNHYLEYENQIRLRLSDDSEELSIQSRFDKSEGQSSFRHFIKTENNNFHRSDIPIDYLLKKIDLVEPLKEL